MVPVEGGVWEFRALGGFGGMRRLQTAPGLQGSSTLEVLKPCAQPLNPGAAHAGIETMGLKFSSPKPHTNQLSTAI